MVAVRLPEGLERRLEELARKTGRTKTFYIHQALLHFLDEQEDAFLSEASLARIRRLKEAPGAADEPARPLARAK